MSDGKFMQITPREMEKWLDHLGYVLKSLVELNPAAVNKICDTCGRFGVGPCEGCSQENPVQWIPEKKPAPAAKEG